MIFISAILLPLLPFANGSQISMYFNLFAMHFNTIDFVQGPPVTRPTMFVLVWKFKLKRKVACSGLTISIFLKCSFNESYTKFSQCSIHTTLCVLQ